MASYELRVTNNEVRNTKYENNEQSQNVKRFFQKIGRVITGASVDWAKDNAPLLAAAISYYTLFSLSPLFIIAIAIVGTIFGPAAVQNEIYEQIKGLIGSQGAQTVQNLILNASNPKSSFGATLFSIIVLLVGASGVFGQLQAALNTVWHVPPKPSHNAKDFIVNYIFSFTMVGGISFLLLVSLLLDAAFTVTGRWISGFLPNFTQIIIFANKALSYCIIVVLFAAIFKLLPNAIVKWTDVWVGAIVTALLFYLGKFFISLYLGSSTIGTTYGAAASIVIILIWTYYSAQIVLFGAEFTKWYAQCFGSRIVPAKVE